MAVINGDQNPANINDSLTGGDEDDVINGLSGNDTLNGGGFPGEFGYLFDPDIPGDNGGDDTLNGGAGDDVLEIIAPIGGVARDKAFGGDGVDAVKIIGFHTFDGLMLDAASSVEVLDLTRAQNPTDLFDEFPQSFSYLDLSGVTTVIHNPFYSEFYMSRNSIFIGSQDGDKVYSELGASIDGRGGADTLIARQNSETLNGGVGDDLITENFSGFYKDTGDDLFEGGDGADTITTIQCDGFDTLTGGDGNDQISYSNQQTATFGGVSISGGDGDDQISILSIKDYVYFETSISGGDGFDSLKISGQFDRLVIDADTSIEAFTTGGLTGTATADLYDLTGIIVEDEFPVWIRMFEGADQFFGGVTRDSIDGGAGNDTLLGGDGDDTLSASNDDDLVAGEDGNDTVDGGAGDDSITGGDGDDALSASDDDDLVAGEGGNDTVDGGAGDDLITGGDGDDYLHGGSGSDTLSGGSGDDTITGSAADGGDGDDIVTFFDGSGGAFSGGDGYDTAIVSPGQRSSLILDASRSFEALDATSGRLSGTSGDDVFDLSGVVELKRSTSILLWNGQDNFSGGVSGEYVDGGFGNDTLDGGGGADTLVGGLSADRLSGGLGDDRFLLEREIGLDTIRGGEGFDTVEVVALATVNVLVLDAAASIEEVILGGRLAGGSGADLVDFSGVQTVRGGLNLNAGHDSFVGGVSNEYGNGGDGDDTLSGGNGADTIVGGLGADLISGGDGDDLLAIDGVAGLDTFSGGAGLDTLVVTAPASVSVLTLDAGASVEFVDLAAGLTGTAGADRVDFSGVSLVSGSLALGEGADAFAGGVGGENVLGGGGNDTLRGGGGADTLTGGKGEDLLEGGGGEDLFQIGAVSGRDDFLGGKAQDTLALVDDADLSRLTLGAANSVEVLEFDGFELSGTSGADQFDLSGVKSLAHRVDDISLLGKADVFVGSQASDIVDGGSGDDRLAGGLGSDRLTGGAGRDFFIFDAKLGQLNVDEIVDFTSKDLIELDAAVFKTLAPGALAEEAFAKSFANVGEQTRIIYDAQTGSLFYDRDGSGDAGAIEFAVLSPQLKVQHGDFVVT